MKRAVVITATPASYAEGTKEMKDWVTANAMLRRISDARARTDLGRKAEKLFVGQRTGTTNRSPGR